MAESVDALLKLVAAIGPYGAFSVIVWYTGYKRIWVWGSTYEELRQALIREQLISQQWQQLAFRGTNLSHAALAEIKQAP